MWSRKLCLKLTLSVLPATAFAGEGMVPPAADALWPQWQARIALQASEVVPLTLSRLLDGAAPQRAWQGGSVLGDYYFAMPSYGGFRASGGVMMGMQGGAPLLSASAGPRLGVAVQAGTAGMTSGLEGAVPYLGVGFSGGAWRHALSVTADFGLVAERPGAAAGVGRALLGNAGLDSTVRELRLSPMFQLGVRYTF
jgi:hypothetical protein